MSLIELNQVPYVKHVPTDGRNVLLAPCFDHAEGRWTLYRTHEGKILPLGASNLVEGLYISTAPADPASDVRIEFTEFIFQHYTLASLADLTDRIEQDLINQLASIHKYFVILHYLNTYDDSSAIGLMTSEIEYVLTNHRSFYDLINRAVSNIFQRVTPRVQELPDSFRRVAQKSAEELKNKFNLPEPLIEFYKGKEKLFMLLRELRDGIVHEGKTPDLMFHFPDGFALSLERHIFSQLVPLGIWREELLKPNRLGLLLVVFNFLVRDMFDTMNILPQFLTRCFRVLPPPVAEGYFTYLRSRFTFHLTKSDYYASKQWVSPNEVLGLHSKPA